MQALKPIFIIQFISLIKCSVDSLSEDKNPFSNNNDSLVNYRNNYLKRAEIDVNAIPVLFQAQQHLPTPSKYEILKHESKNKDPSKKSKKNHNYKANKKFKKRLGYLEPSYSNNILKPMGDIIVETGSTTDSMTRGSRDNGFAKNVKNELFDCQNSISKDIAIVNSDSTNIRTEFAHSKQTIMDSFDDNPEYHMMVNNLNDAYFEDILINSVDDYNVSTHKVIKRMPTDIQVEEHKDDTKKDRIDFSMIDYLDKESDNDYYQVSHEEFESLRQEERAESKQLIRD